MSVWSRDHSTKQLRRLGACSHEVKDAVLRWAIEIRRFGLKRDINEWTMNIGHATQIFWAETTTVGCGMLTCTDGMISVVCHYYPKGNYAEKRNGTRLSYTFRMRKA
ncbi:hypothetical protein COOONC_18577 [Cooperia oncophora]